MKDYLKEFKKQKSRKNLLIISSSLAFALMMNLFYFATPAGIELQTSVKNATTPKTTWEVKSDIYLQLKWTWSDTLGMKIWTEIKNVSEIRVSLIYNPNEEDFKINNIVNDEDKNLEIIKISNTPWITSLTCKFQTPTDLKEWYNIANIVYTKLTKDRVAINLTETVFVSEKESYELKNSWVEF